MTTAARPTFDPARGGTGRGEKDLSGMSKQYSSRDLPSHTKLKYRETGQGTTEELKAKDFRKELEEKEKVSKYEKIKEQAIRRDQRPIDGATFRDKIPAITSKKSRIGQIPAANLDADDPIEEDEDDSDDSSDDDTMELMAELQRIKQERSIEEAKREAEKKAEEERIRMENILSGNPLLTDKFGNSQKNDFKVKRRWDDDVVFKNCARGEPDRSQKRFINDSLRSEFHKKFMEKYIK